MATRRSTRSATVAASAASGASTPTIAAASTSTPAPAPVAASAKKTKAAASRKRTVEPDDADDAPAPKRTRKQTKTADDAAPATKADDKMDVDNDDAKSDKADDKKDTDKKGKKVDKKEDKKDDDAKMVTVLKRGAAPVDPCSGRVHTHQVYQVGDEVYDAMLNQTNIAANNNKFYVIQILHPTGNSNACFVFTRWGRVGENGQQATKGPFPPTSAIANFKSTFRNKTSGNWESRKTMTSVPGKYTWIERSFEEPKEIKLKDDEEDVIIPDSKLEPEIQGFCNMIFSSDLMSAALSSMNYDANKLPLGNLSKNTILRGFAALKEIAEVLDSPNGAKSKSLGGVKSACATLSAQYYSIIPHSFGRARPEPIDTKPKLKRELELVDALGDMEIAQKLIDDKKHTDADGNVVNPIDAHFASLDLKFMQPIKGDSAEHATLQEYVTSTHGFTHGSANNKILQAFRVERHEEAERWSKDGFDSLNDGERLLLWHGSRSTNFAGILKQGLRIAPPEAPATGYMFGKGVYFADAMSKSANYCHAYSSQGVGILLLCEVAAKPFFEQFGSNYNAHTECGQAGKLSTKGLGRSQPVDWQDAGVALGHDELKGCWMPKGGLDNSANSNAYLQYNEYIVYQPSQIKLRYLMMVKMH
ncbi:PARP-domain-containing protein [Serendipita vermifera]|nr:PARP-domain-containing protein [Serendipita vermifera]